VVTSQALVGKLGLVTIGVRGGVLSGEVRVVVEGIAHYYIAYCEHPVQAGKQVLVINSRGARQIDVELWQDLCRDIDDMSG
jgi:membrane protein implicated in regulation of membrane protease activity